MSPGLGSAAAGAAALPGPSPRLTTAPLKSRRATCGGRPQSPRGRWYGPGTVARRRNGLFPGWWRGCPGSAEVPHGQRDTALRADPSVRGRDAGHGPWRRLMAPRDSGESHRGVTPLELLVDLCFVVASKRKPTSPPWTASCVRPRCQVSRARRSRPARVGAYGGVTVHRIRGQCQGGAEDAWTQERGPDAGPLWALVRGRAGRRSGASE